ncbi:MAG: sensor histidine kinase [Burkholderiales bacterium]|nr:sensor histidine kinase [Burkholderiales bacterium]
MSNTATQPAQCRTTQGMHPLEFIPIFRLIPRSLPRDLVYTFIWNLLFVLLFVGLNLLFNAGAPLSAMLWPIFVIAQCIGFCIHALFVAGERLLPDINARGLGAKALFYTVLPLFGTFIGYWLAATLLDYQTMRAAIFSPRGALAIGTVSVIISSVLLLIFIPRARAARMQAAFEHEQARVAVAERSAALAQLKLLEAQVEPHFLYNTLANVVSLIDSEPATAKQMIERLIALLRGSAAAAGCESTTLSAQIDHLRARLRALYGAAATLVIEDNVPTGARITLRIPVGA